ncbi:MAG TPA: response regulator [Candidatus Binatia bacterium]|nr:response regulator [Candidatus Binatia bacterium]
MGDDRFDPSALIALLLDENHYERGISLDQLRMMGVGRVLCASNTAEAWEMLDRADPHILLMEWLDRTGDGLDLVRRIRASEDLPNRALSIFMLTARASQADVEHARRAGADGFLRKPISALALKQRIKRVITHPQPFVVTANYVGPCRRRRRGDLNYLGPRRRLNDVTAQHADQDEDDFGLKVELARARVAALEVRARELVAGDAKVTGLVYNAVQDLVEVSEQIGDPCLKLGAQEMARYMQAQGATDRLDPEVVRTHVAALHQLVHLPHALGAERLRVAEGLKRMVDKKLRQAAAISAA